MWDFNEHGKACFRVNDWLLQVGWRPEGVDLIAICQASRPSAGTVSLVDRPLPALAESFIRGDELHLLMPQDTAGQAGLALALLIIQADRDSLVVESTLSIETLLLDAHPIIDLAMPGDGPLADEARDTATVFSRDNRSAGVGLQRPRLQVLVDQRDQPSLDPSCKSAGSLRFFGDFMEKGVIRKAQPWWVWTNADANADCLTPLVRELARRPLPLAN